VPNLFTVGLLSSLKQDMLKYTLPGRPQTSESYVEYIRILYVQSKKKTILNHSLQLVPKSMKQDK
jgi:hypothetical protein